MSMIKSRTRMALIRVERQDDIDGKPQPAVINERNRAPIRQFLNLDTREQMGSDRVAYFHAEKVGNIWFIAQRQRGGWSW